MNQHILVLTTVPDAEAGQIIAEQIVRERLAACVTISSESQSLYWWEGKISQEQEFMLFIKTRKDLFTNLKKKILDIHPYEVPEIIALPILLGHKKYLDWIGTETQS